MSKDWIDINLVLDETEDMTDNKFKSYKYMMQEIPKHSKDKKYDNAHRVYEKNEFVILKVYSGNKTGFILYNTNKEWEGGHTHLKSFDMAKTIISNVTQRKKPKTSNVYLMRSHMRVSDDAKYIEYIEQLIITKREKTKQEYYMPR